MIGFAMSEEQFEFYQPPEVPNAPRQRQPEAQPGGGNNPHEQDQDPGEKSEQISMSPGRRMLIISCVLLMIVSFAFIVRSAVFTIRNIRVIGTHDVTWQQVALSAGLSPSSNYFRIKESYIKAGINNNRYLIYQRMQKVFPNTLIIYVKERLPVASIHYIGISYTMADDGLILSKSKKESNHRLMTVSGLALRDIREGKLPLSTKSGQIETCISLVNELHDQNFDDHVLDINMSEPSRIYLTTRDGFSIHMGDGKFLRAKIATIRAVIEELRKRQYQGGVIEATVPGEATYRPDSI